MNLTRIHLAHISIERQLLFFLNGIFYLFNSYPANVENMVSS